jgi:NAD+ diphosphatase
VTVVGSVIFVSERTLPHLALSAHAHNRLGERRTDDAWLDEQWADPATRVLVVAGNRLRHVEGVVPWLPAADAPAGTRVLLGEVDGAARFAVLADPSAVDGEREDWVPLRGVFPALTGDPGQAPLLFHAVGLAEWHWATRHCPRCGGALASSHAGHELRCAECGRPQFPRTDPAVIMAITDGEPGADDERLLLGHQAAWPEGRYSTLAGFVEPGEAFEDAVRREVAEEVGVTVGEVTYVGNQPWPLPASLMIGFRGRAVTTRIDVDGAEIAQARWFTREDLRRGCESGELLVPSGVSISSSLIEGWYGGPLPGGW